MDCLPAGNQSLLKSLSLQILYIHMQFVEIIRMML